MAVDLHLHTNHSDGSLTPEELIDLLQTYNVKTFAITDHDTISAIPQAALYAQKKNMQLISGVELSIDYPLPKTAHLHLLGLFIDVQNAHLIEALEQLRKHRERRAWLIIEKLKGLGVPITTDEVERLNHYESVGRPHIARLLLQKGVVNRLEEAFERFIGRNAPAYVPKKKFNLQEALNLIHQAKGLAIVAHPISLGAKSEKQLYQQLDELVAQGVDGLEVYYATHDQHLTALLLDYAQQNKLAISGGSDFHGAAKKDIQPVIGLGNLKIPDAIVEALHQFYHTKFSTSPVMHPKVLD